MVHSCSFPKGSRMPILPARQRLHVSLHTLRYRMVPCIQIFFPFRSYFDYVELFGISPFNRYQLGGLYLAYMVYHGYRHEDRITPEMFGAVARGDLYLANLLSRFFACAPRRRVRIGHAEIFPIAWVYSLMTDHWKNSGNPREMGILGNTRHPKKSATHSESSATHS